MKSIIVKDITKSFGSKRALDHVSLEIRGTFGLLGPNGAGKTTLMKLLATLDIPDSGIIRIDEDDLSWNEPSEVRERLGYLPQHFSIYRSLKVEEVMNHFAILKGIRGKKVRSEAINSILQSVNLSEQKTKKVKNLSGGMLRRLGIAQALLGNPQIIIVDEPTAGLDIEERVRFCRLLRKIGENRIIIISTHIVEDLESTCDHIAIMKEGKILQTGTRNKLAEMTKGLVFEMDVPFDSPIPIKEEDIISIKQLNNRYLVRFFSEASINNARTVDTCLEDTYLYITKRNLTHV
ncbi:ABC transporter ATP-binding protein [Ureibacillus sp. 179-F W5.1 NHS]|uniref:ABC transporter ATP-binding protein n=1 Tax=Lysinibacillus halotolerans TaxID=1368476 RepID=A0A3M8H980_9BACI|nr:ABC transporter ATP-binding protein [Lysinibacillus halotolerans]RNC98971.1 ABC transporter ATP-binding protein [Lysinibacillus halotolerans]